MKSLIEFLQEHDINAKVLNDSMFKTTYVSLNNKRICEIHYDLKVVANKYLYEDEEKHLAKVRRVVKKYKELVKTENI
jgi:hypothetical protein